MKKILIPAAVLIISSIQAQQPTNKASLPNIIPPSPTAYALGNYGNVPVGLFTGSPNISVPLFSFKTRSIDLPITLSYSSNGVKVDEISTNVGLGWNLNFGGVITRMVRDRADETSTHIALPETLDGAYNNPVTNNFLFTVGNASDALDTEADQYSFNFNGYSGKFFYDQNNQPHIVDQQAVKIERIGNTNGDGQDFLLTVSDGAKYYFTEKETTIYRSVGSGHSTPSGAVTAWYLTKIVHPNGDEVYLNYEESELSQYTASQSQILMMSVGYPGLQPRCQGSGYSSAPAAGAIVNNTIQISGKRILSISSNGAVDGSITFEYDTNPASLDIVGNKKIKTIRLLDKNGAIIESASLSYLNTANKRNFLSSITFKDPQKIYGFEYENPAEFPERLSKAQDHWGYYNGVLNNSVLVPKNISDYGLSKFNYGGANKDPNPSYSKLGMLKKVIYPTKGYTELEYEGNTYWGERTIMPSLYTKYLDVETDTGANSRSVEYTLISPINQTISIRAMLSSNSLSECESFANSGHYAGSVRIGQGTIYPLTRDHVTQQISFNAVAGQTYTITARANFMCSVVNTEISYYQTAPQTFNTNLDTGGVRVKSTKDVDPVSTVPIYKRYHYAHKDDITHSSGLKGNKAYYTDIDKRQISCYDTQVIGGCYAVIENSDVVLSSSSLIPLYDTGVMSCLYPFVTISHGGDNFENGGEMKEFAVQRDDPASNIWGPGNISSSPWTNRGWSNGAELKSLTLRKNSGSSTLDIIQEKENIYGKNDAVVFELKNFTGKKLYDFGCGGQLVHPYTCTAGDVIKPNNMCTGLTAGTAINLPDLENLNINEYRSISYWHYLKSQKTTDYLVGMPVKTETEYFYNNSAHYQLNHQKTTFPDGKIGEIVYSYAHEKGNQLMINKNMVGIPLETSTTQTIGNTTKTLSRAATIYPKTAAEITNNSASLVLPLSAISYDLQNPTASTTEVNYDKYDEKGNILQYTAKDGTPVSIIWGYDQTKPIAKIEGLAYSWLLQNYPNDVINVINASNVDVNEGVNSDESAFLSALQTFSNKISIDRFRPLVTTYTYDPLIGVRSITPPSGIREVYIYDTANRLKEVKQLDKNGVYRIAKEYQYNYKN
ncbi:hypothetical protein [Chryseobacterium sp.]|uniref:hypothetical protein n=1 Tax=Chryseobacterium sp. TaxID=1871047 RepID=UPI000EE9F411|nr:hypothetical protein [Chryseobacterium sp.]HCA06167.1 hypothetical protein [Chryseobacterium sp.]